jgi:hypothetical protein
VQTLHVPLQLALFRLRLCERSNQLPDAAILLFNIILHLLALVLQRVKIRN